MNNTVFITGNKDALNTKALAKFIEGIESNGKKTKTLTGYEFMNEVISSLRSCGLKEFRSSYYNELDTLVLREFETLEKGELCQNELSKIMQVMRIKEKSMIFISSRTLGDLNKINPDIKTMLDDGLKLSVH